MIKVIEITESKNKAFEMVNFETVLDSFDVLAGRKPVKKMLPFRIEDHQFEVGQTISGRTIKVNSSATPYYEGQIASRKDTNNQDVYLESEIVKL